jgi:hypothetical protein
LGGVGAGRTIRANELRHALIEVLNTWLQVDGISFAHPDIVNALSSLGPEIKNGRLQFERNVPASVGLALNEAQTSTELLDNRFRSTPPVK